jgi:hypothetical protein
VAAVVEDAIRLEESFAPSSVRAQEEPAYRVLEASSSSPVATTPLIPRPRSMAEVLCARARSVKGLLAIRSAPRSSLGLCRRPGERSSIDLSWGCPQRFRRSEPTTSSVRGRPVSSLRLECREARCSDVIERIRRLPGTG